MGQRKSFQLNRNRYASLKKQYTKIIHRNGLSKARRSVTDHYYDLPVQEKTVLLCGLGRNINGSLKYILDELNHSSRFEGFRIYVRTTAEQTDASVNEHIKEYGWNRTATVPKKYDMMMETCRYLLTESWFPYQYIKRPEQTLINIWHGTPLKRLGALINGDKCHVNAQIQKNFLSSDYLMYPNDFTKDVMYRSYQISQILPGQALMMGYPRTAGILKVTDEEKKKLRSELAPGGGRIYAYAPTFREYMDDDDFIEMISPMLEYMETSLSDDEVLYVNLHHYRHRNNCLDLDGCRHIRKFPPELDTYQVLSVTDVLISDYSSIFFDYLITGNKVILYIPDLDTYNENQGLNLDIRKLPLDLAHSKEELLEKLRTGNKARDDEDASGEKEDLTSFYRYDSAENPEKLCGLFLGDESGLELSPAPRSGRSAVLLYTDGFISEPETDMVRDLALNKGNDAYDVYVGCDEKITDEHKENAYPLLHDVNVLASLSSQPLSSVGAPVKELYLSGKLSFRKAISFLSHEYALTYRRMYGNADIDLICIMDSCDPETVIGLCLSPVKHVMLTVSSEAVRGMKSGNTFLKDAVRFASGYVDVMVTLNDDDKAYVRSILPLFKRSVLRTAEGSDSMDSMIRSLLKQ
ncbi:MAG: CDP-glycerol glycerophosphotransferase family protein [Eubacterium sp.]|nr:CDP-glycerol glycerophosphotransferase family protein [Eubacterium sp.]